MRDTAACNHVWENGRWVPMAQPSTAAAGSTQVAISAVAGRVRAWVPDSTTVSGQGSSAGDNTVLSSAATGIYVYGYCLSALSTAAQVIRFLNGSTNETWRVRTLGGSSAGIGVAISELAVTPPAYLFRTAPGNPLLLNLTSSGVNYSVSAWRE